jgi:hypothetical protein
MAKYTFTLTAEFDDAHDPDTIGNAIDTLLETAQSTPGILDDLGDPTIGDTDGQLQAMLEQPETDDATYVLREVYELLGLPIPSFLD